MNFSSAAGRNRLSRLRHWAGRMITPGFPIALDYPIDPKPRYGYGKSAHPQLSEIINERRAVYKKLLEDFLPYKSDICQIEAGPDRIQWKNDFLTAFDAVALYSLIRLHRPSFYIEIGSGHSTRFARRAAVDEQLELKIVSVDPHARVGIRQFADHVIEQSVENMPLEIFDSLQSGDILFVDHSHRAFTNSDTTVVFLDILPRLRPGVLVHFHDIFLPADYPPEWKDRYYSEQYLLACHLLGRTQSFEILLANAFVSGDAGLRAILAPLWSDPALHGVEQHGCSFWVRMRSPRSEAVS